VYVATVWQKIYTPLLGATTIRHSAVCQRGVFTLFREIITKKKQGLFQQENKPT
jgi:hypothetical protein